MKNKNKEYRSVTFDILENESTERKISGVIRYNERSLPLPFIEIITPNAFKKSIADGYNVKFLYEHREADLLGCLKNNSLQLENREDGLYFTCRFPETRLAEDVYNLIRENYISNVSFGMIVMQDTWTYENNAEVRYLDEVKLLEISVVSEPAYPSTTVFCRSLSQALENKEILTDEEQEAVRKEIEALQAKLPHEEEQKEEEIEQKAVEEEQKEDEEQKARQEAEAKEMEELYKRLEAAEKILLNE